MAAVTGRWQALRAQGINEGMLYTIHKVTRSPEGTSALEQKELAQTKRGGQAPHLAKTIIDFDFLD